MSVGDDGAEGLAADRPATVPGLTGDDLDRRLAEAGRVCIFANALRSTAKVSVAATKTMLKQFA